MTNNRQQGRELNLQVQELQETLLAGTTPADPALTSGNDACSAQHDAESFRQLHTAPPLRAALVVKNHR